MATNKQKAGWLAIAVAAVGAFEGLRTVAYMDPVGIPTICFGETAGVKMGDRKTVPECEALLEDSLKEAEAILDRCAPGVGDKLPPPTKAAVVSFIFNVGPGGKGLKDGFCTLKSGNPSSMRRYLVAGEFERACNEFPNWATAKGVALRGLAKRRAEEQRMCLEGLKAGL